MLMIFFYSAQIFVVLGKCWTLCVDEFADLHLTLNVKKSCILRFGARYMHNCKEVQFDGGTIAFCREG